MAPGGGDSHPRQITQGGTIEAVSQRSSTLIRPAPAPASRAGTISQLFAEVRKALTSPAPKRAAPKKRKRGGEDRDGQFQKLVAKFLRRLHDRRDLRQRIKAFFAASEPRPEMMHIDARYRDTLGTGRNLGSAAAAPLQITGPSLDL